MVTIWVHCVNVNNAQFSMSTKIYKCIVILILDCIIFNSYKTSAARDFSVCGQYLIPAS